MAKFKLSPFLTEMRGQIGNLVFRQVRGKLVVSQAPDYSKRVSSDKQLARRQQFRTAHSYGRRALADPATRLAYEAVARREGKPVYAIMIRDYSRPPVIHDIDLRGYDGRAGGTIRIQASDDFEVVRVEAAITDDRGAVVESGPAVPGAPGTLEWTYRAASSLPSGAPIRITATAVDRPGNRTTREATWSAPASG